MGDFEGHTDFEDVLENRYTCLSGVFENPNMLSE